MNILIITAHPSTQGFTHKIAKSYYNGAKKSNHQVEILDLYKEENMQKYFAYENIRDIPIDNTKDRMQAKIKEADELVFIFPLWWMGMPAIMKNFIDINFSAGFSYKYKKFPIIKGRPVGLLKGKTARVFITCDGSKWFYKPILTPFKLNMKYFFLVLCGIKVKSFIIFDRMRWRSDKQKQKWLDKV